MTLSQARQHLAEGNHFARGSMAPKIQAIIGYLEQGGRRAIISNPDNLERALTGETGTHITPD
jgi:carbamate kinase